MKKGNKNNKPIVILVVSLAVLVLIIGIILIVASANGSPRVTLLTDDVIGFESNDMPGSVSLYYEWSDTMSGFMSEGANSRINTVSDQLKSISEQMGSTLQIEKFTDNTSGALPALTENNVRVVTDTNMTASMISAECTDDIKIIVTDLIDKNGTLGMVNSAINNSVFTSEFPDNALAIISVMSDYNGQVANSQQSSSSNHKRPFFVMISGKNTRVSYVVGEFLKSSKIRTLKEDGELNCELLASKCGIAGIDYKNIDIYESNEEDEQVAKDLEERSRPKSDSFPTVGDIENTEANVNFVEKSSIIRTNKEDGLQKSLAYQATVSTESAGKLKLKIPYLMLQGVNIAAMVPTLTYEVSTLDTNNVFEPFAEKIKPEDLRIELAYVSKNAYTFVYDMLEKEMSPTEAHAALTRKIKNLREQKLLESEFEKDANKVLSLLETNDIYQILPALESNLNMKFNRNSSIPVGTKVNEIDNSVAVNTIFSTLSKMPIDKKTKMLKIDYTIEFGYDQGNLPMWVTEQNAGLAEEMVNGKVPGLYEMFEALYSSLQKNNNIKNTFTAYIKLKN